MLKLLVVYSPFLSLLISCWLSPACQNVKEFPRTVAYAMAYECPIHYLSIAFPIKLIYLVISAIRISLSGSFRFEYETSPSCIIPSRYASNNYFFGILNWCLWNCLIRARILKVWISCWVYVLMDCSFTKIDSGSTALHGQKFWKFPISEVISTSKSGQQK